MKYSTDDMRNWAGEIDKIAAIGGVRLAMKEGADEIDRLREALIWCGGSPDFSPGGQARAGWEKIVLPLITPAE